MYDDDVLFLPHYHVFDPIWRTIGRHGIPKSLSETILQPNARLLSQGIARALERTLAKKEEHQ